MDTLPDFEKAVGILSALLAIVPSLGQVCGLSSAERRIEAIDRLLTVETYFDESKKVPLLESRKKLQARIASLILVPGNSLYLYAVIFLVCLIAVFFSQDPGRVTLLWNLTVLVTMTVGVSGVIRVAGARQAVYEKVLQGHETTIQTKPQKLLEGPFKEFVCRITFALIVIITIMSLILLLFSVGLGDWQRTIGLMLLAVLGAIVSQRGWRLYVGFLISDNQCPFVGAFHTEIRHLIKHSRALWRYIKRSL